MKILVTGSSGMIGTSLTKRLRSLGYDVYEYDIKRSKEYNCLQPIKVKQKINVVIHLAANASVLPLQKDSRLAYDNVLMSYNVANFAKNNKVRKVIFASSREVYENNNNYARSKDISEKVLSKKKYKYYKLVVLRLANVYGGSRDSQERVIPTFFRKAMANEKLTIFGKDKFLDFVYIDDVIDAFVSALETNFKNKKPVVIPIGSGTRTTLVSLAEKIKELTKSKSKIVVEKNRSGETLRYVTNTQIAQKKLGFKAKVLLADGLKRTYNDQYLLLDSYNTRKKPTN